MRRCWRYGVAVYVGLMLAGAMGGPNDPQPRRVTAESYDTSSPVTAETPAMFLLNRSVDASESLEREDRLQSAR
jgi:hypothetical protein